MPAEHPQREIESDYDGVRDRAAQVAIALACLDRLIHVRTDDEDDPDACVRVVHIMRNAASSPRSWALAIEELIIQCERLENLILGRVEPADLGGNEAT